MNVCAAEMFRLHTSDLRGTGLKDRGMERMQQGLEAECVARHLVESQNLEKKDCLILNGQGVLRQ